jgi:hypothetical protein
MRQRRSILRFPAIAGLVMAAASAGYGQQHATVAKKKAPAPVQRLTLPAQQRQFCAVFEDDVARRSEFEEKVAAARNAIGAALAKKNKPDLERLFRAQQFAVMGSGVFQDWVGYANPAVDNFHRAYVSIEFPCKWTSTRNDRKEGNNLYLRSRGFEIDSAPARALASLVPGEAVIVSGQLSCSPVTDVPQSGGCDGAGNQNLKQIIWTTFATIRSEKTGEVARLGADPKLKNVGDQFKKVDLLRRASITFYKSDDAETLQAKAMALAAQKPSLESVKLLNYLLSTQCGPCENSLKPVQFTVFEVSAEGRPVMRDIFSIYVPGDLPSLKGLALPLGTRIWVQTNHGACTAVSSEELARLQQNTQQISELLHPLGMQLIELNNPPAAAQPNPCESLNTADKKQADAVATARKKRLEEMKAVSVNLTADEFGVRLGEAVKSRASKLAVDPSKYATAARTVSDIVHLCSSMSEADFAGSMDKYEIPRLVRYREGKFKVCNSTGVYVAIPEGKEPGFLIHHDLEEHWDSLQKRWYAPKFHIDVFLKPIEGDKWESVDELEARYVAISADITDGGLTAAPRYLCSGAIISMGSSESVTLTAPARITRLKVIGDGEAMIEVDGYGFHTIPAEQVKNSCTQGSNAAAANSLAHPTSIKNNQQLVKVCRNAKLFASPPVGSAAQGSGRLLGNAEPGDEGVILQKNERVSKIEFDLPGQKFIGWLPNSALCPNQ